MWFTLVGFALVAGIVMIVAPARRLGGVGLHSSNDNGQPHTLVVYNFVYWDPEHLNNFNYFIKHGIRGNDGADYVIILDHEIASELLNLPPFPSNVQVVKSVGPCNELGLVGWLFKRQPHLLNHEYFVFVDSSARGPYLPAYAQRWMGAWHRLLTTMITPTVKLVGATVSCAPFKYHLNEGGFIVHPYVSAYLMATDRVGINLMNATEPNVFHCWHGELDIQRYGVIAATESVLQANYNFDVLMLKYQGVDWRDASKWACNARIDPHYEGRYDGISLDPLEVMFVRVDHHDLVVSAPQAVAALKYEQWSEANVSLGSDAITSNEWQSRAARDIKKVAARGKQCFDAKYYISQAPFEFKGWTGDTAWEHFITYGYKEGRAYQFQC